MIPMAPTWPMRSSWVLWGALIVTTIFLLGVDPKGFWARPQRRGWS